MTPPRRLVVPLKEQYFRAFQRGTKTWELRAVGPMFNPERVQTGRLVLLMRAYTKDQLEGTIGRIETSTDYRKLSGDALQGLELWHPGWGPKESTTLVSAVVSPGTPAIAFECLNLHQPPA